MQFETLERRLSLSASTARAAGAVARLDVPVGPIRPLPGPVASLKGTKTKAPQLDSGPPAPGIFISPGAIPLALSAQPLASGGVRINWQPLGLTPEGQIVVFRKSVDALDWTAPAIAEPSFNATSYDDVTAVTGVAYEYKVVVYNELGAAPSEKYILAGNGVAPIQSRGTVLLVVDETQLDTTRDANGTSLLPALRAYQADLISEGYRVQTITAPRVDIPRSIPTDLSPASIAAYYGAWSGAVMTLKARIRAIYQQTPDLSSIFIIGHVAVPYSGMDPPDGEAHADSHGAWPADVFYGTLSIPDSAWTDTLDSELGDGVNRNLPGDGKFDQDQLLQLGAGTQYENASFTDVPVGRIDFSQLDPFNGISFFPEAVAGVAETNLLSRYLQKDHEWRTGQWTVNHQALFEEQFPFAEYYDPNRLTPNIGLGNVVSGTTAPIGTAFPVAPQAYDLTQKSWLWMYAGGSGYNSRAQVHFSDTQELWSYNYVNGIYAKPGSYAAAVDEGSHKAVFNFVYGSYVGDWDEPRSLLRTIIAEPDGLGLASAWGARPKWDQHRMGLGLTIGDSLLRSIDNFGSREAYEYDPNESNTRVSLLGDPTLRQENVIPPTAVVAGPGTGGAGTTLSWTASADPSVAGYYVYRSSSANGPFTLLNAAMTAATTFTDPATPITSEAYYLVRAAKLQASASGTYWNLSLGATAAPRVISTRFFANSRTQAIEVTFNQDVSASLAAGDFVITGNRRDFASGADVPITLTPNSNFHLASYNAATRTARIEFDAIAGSPVAGMIPSGRYTLSFSPGSVTNAFQLPVSEAYTFDFGYLAGDATGDFKVDFDDLVVVAQRYGSSVLDGSLSGDFNGDGVVDFDDLVTLAQHYGVSI